MTGADERKSGSGREIAMLVGILVLVAAGSVATYWMRSDSVEAAGKTVPAVVRAVAPAPLPVDVSHTDVYFDFKSVRLRADAVRTLQETAAGMDRSSTWAVLVQGYADRQGSHPRRDEFIAIEMMAQRAKVGLWAN